jgi:hypothetical protein
MGGATRPLFQCSGCSMIQSVKEWLEGLFRPVIRISDRGSYIDRTPTTEDMERRTDEAIFLGRITAGLGVYTNFTIVPQGETWVLRAYQQSNQTANSIHVLHIVFVSGQSYYSPLITRANIVPGSSVETPPLILPTGTQLRGYTYNGGVAVDNFVHNIIVSRLRR